MKKFKYILLSLLLFLTGTIYPQGQQEERVFVHCDRKLYVAGEDLLFSFFLLGESSQKSSVGYLELINSNNGAVAQSQILLADAYGYGVLSIPDSITTGVYYLSAYTRYMRNYGPASFHTQEIAVYNPFKELPLPVSTDTIFHKEVELSLNENSDNIIFTGSPGKIFSTREKATMRFRLDTASFSEPGLCRISASVAVSAGEIPSSAINDILTVDRAIRPAESEISNTKIYGEYEGHFLEGSVISRESLQAVEGERLYLSLPGKNPFIQYSITDENGHFSFLLPFFMKNSELIIQPSDFNRSSIIKTESPFAPVHDYRPSINTIFDDNLSDYASRLGVNYQVNKIFEISNELSSAADSIPGVFYRFYGQPEIELFLDNYIDLPTMDEVFHELIPGVALRKQGENAVFVFTQEPGAPPLKGPDAVLLDGVILDNPSIIAAIDPGLIERIDVIKTPYQVGGIIFNGIISIISRKGNMCGLDYPGNGLRTATAVPAGGKDYHNLVYNDSIPSDPRIPDFRNTLFWNPELKPDDEGIIEFTFYTSDFLSDYVITIQGITDKYVPVSYSGKIKVTR